ncbi:hypothetical protein M9Y10_043410 [Tritrichomonas musculus]|uniref:Phosphoprotein phosphatase n=1 Tax=Tritrichomonas musculus TaxID=1915356 RepID=A0ABR2JZM2_9EUKA
MSLLERYRIPHPSSLTLIKFDHEACRVSPIRKLFNSTSAPVFPSVKSANIENIPKNNRLKTKSFPNLEPSGRNGFKNSNGNTKNKKYHSLEENDGKDIDELDSVIDDIDVPFSFQSKSKKVHSNIEMKKLPPLPFISNRNFSEALREKCKLCETMCDFFDPEGDLLAKEIKLQELTDIFDAIAVNFSKLSKYDFCNILNMIEKHIFRPVNEIDPKYTFSDGLVLFVDQSWPHLSIIYQMLTSLMTTLPSMFDISFIKKVIDRFKAPFINEQSQLSSIVIQFLYSNPDKIEQVVNIISNLFIEYLYGSTDPYAMLPALTVFHVVNEQCPDLTLKLYFTHFLPLLRSPHYAYFQDIFYQIIFNIFKNKSNQRLALPTIKYIIKHWPKTRSSKQVNFFSILTLSMTNLDPMEFQEIMIPVFHLITVSSCSEHQKIASAAFSIWTPIEIELMIMDNSRSLFPIIYKPVSEALEDHWSASVQDILHSILRAMDRIDPYAFHEVSKTAISNPQSNLGQKNSLAQNSLLSVDSNHDFFKGSNTTDYYNNSDINGSFSLNNNISSNSFYHSNNINNLFSNNNSNNHNSNFSNIRNGNILSSNRISLNDFDSVPSIPTNNNVNGGLPVIHKRAIKKTSSLGNNVKINPNVIDNIGFNTNNRNNWRGNFVTESRSTSSEDSDESRNNTRRRPANIASSNSSLNQRIKSLIPLENISDDNNHEKIRMWASIVKLASMVDDQINIPQKLREIQRAYAKAKKIRFSKSLSSLRKGLRK